MRRQTSTGSGHFSVKAQQESKDVAGREATLLSKAIH